MLKIYTYIARNKNEGRLQEGSIFFIPGNVFFFFFFGKLELKIGTSVEYTWDIFGHPMNILRMSRFPL